MRPLALRASQKRLELSWALDDGIPEYLKGVLINLVNDAIKFTKDGSVSARATRVSGKDGKLPLRTRE